MRNEIRNKIRAFLAQNAGVSQDQLTDDLDLFENEIWDSLLIVRFFAFADKEFGVDADLSTVTEDQIRTVSAASEYLFSLSGRKQ